MTTGYGRTQYRETVNSLRRMMVPKCNYPPVQRWAVAFRGYFQKGELDVGGRGM